MSIKKVIITGAKKNYAFFSDYMHKRGFWLFEIHHGLGRTGILKACLHTYRALTGVNHNDPVVLKVIRTILLPDKEKIFTNWNHGDGCKFAYFKACRYCAMLKGGFDDKKPEV